MLLDPRPSSSLPPSLATHPSPSAPPPPPPQPPPSNLLDDIFSSSRSPSPRTSRPTSPSTSYPHNHQSSNSTHPSDIPRLRSTHSTAGYREGLAAAKTAALQGGFDEGFTLGAVIGLRVGELVGVLEGVCRALRGRGGKGKGRVGRGEKGDGERGKGRDGEAQRGDEVIKRVFDLRRAAAEELGFQKIFAPELWDGDGVWMWDVPSVSTTTAGASPASTAAGEVDDEITFPAVAAAHPAIKKWAVIVEQVMREWGIKRGVFEGEEWEAGRVGG